VGVSLGFADRRRALVGVLLLGGCLPRGDLAGYSENQAQQQPGALEVAVPALTPAGAEAPESASNESDPGASPSDSESASTPSLVSLLPPDVPVAQGITGSTTVDVDAGVGTADGGVPAEADAGNTTLVDAGTTAGGDAGIDTEAACTSAGGALEPETLTCVFIAAEQLSWPAAVAACAAQGRQLVSLESPALDAFLTSLLTEDVWIGASDPVMLNPASNGFVWLDGTPVISTNWALGEPDAQANQFCVSKTSAAPTAPWRDRPCAELKSYVCAETGVFRR
jgi:hypothetical protein